jgi:acetyl-CoA synthetase
VTDPPASLASDASAGYAWTPTQAHLERSRLRRFMLANGIATLDALRRRAVDDPTWFWDAVVRDLDLEFFKPYEQVVDLSRGLPWARYFVGARYNYVHNAVDRHASEDWASREAIVWEGEDGAVRRLSYGELAEATNRVAAGLRRLGIGPGDRVGVFMPMVPEVAIATLACGKIGAIFTPIFSGYAAPAVASRLQDCGARALITADGFYRRGNVVPMAATAIEAMKLAPTVENLVMVPRLGDVEIPPVDGLSWWHDLLAGADPIDQSYRADVDDPLMIIYTSGTTGRPKGTVHVHGGFPIKASQDLAHCFDLQSDDRLFWITDLGWMMGPWVIQGGLTLGSTLIFYEGAIDFPKPDRLWQIVERHQVTLLGISPTAVRALMTKGDDWVRAHNRGTLRAFGSTGEPWNLDPWWWLFRVAGESRRPIINYSGGTEISGGIVSSFTIEPQQPGSFSGPVPGMAADVVDENCQPVRRMVGELVVRRPWVGMTRGFWQDPDRYLETYWSRWENVWYHGDWARVDADGSWYIVGRSDDTIKLAGKRVGPAEVESAAVAHPSVAEAAAVGVPHPVKGESLVVLVVPRSGTSPSDRLREEIRQTIDNQLGRALRPDDVRFVTEIPRTRNGKILRRIARGAYLGLTDLGDLSALENPTALDAVRSSA